MRDHCLSGRARLYMKKFSSLTPSSGISKLTGEQEEAWRTVVIDPEE